VEQKPVLVGEEQSAHDQCLCLPLILYAVDCYRTFSEFDLIIPRSMTV